MKAMFLAAGLSVFGITFGNSDHKDDAENFFHPEIPQAAYKYRRKLIRHAQYHFGLDAPVPLLAAQIEKESTWRPKVCSKYACGLAQVTEPTAEYLGDKFEILEDIDVTNPDWSIHAQSLYMMYLVDKSKGVDECNAWAKALSAYNGGIGWLRRDEKVTETKGSDPKVWWNSVEVHKDSRRSQSAVAENTEYPRRVILEMQKKYYESGFAPGRLICENML